MTHLNAAGAGLMPESVLAAVKSHLDLEARRGAHWAAADARHAIEEARILAGRLTGVAPTHLAFGEQASRWPCAASRSRLWAWDMPDGSSKRGAW
jgi:cysteine desulfurase / selenocysteine lyase